MYVCMVTIVPPALWYQEGGGIMHLAPIKTLGAIQSLDTRRTKNYG